MQDLGAVGEVCRERQLIYLIFIQIMGTVDAIFLIHRKFLPMNQNAPRGCAARGDEVYAEHTARARKCATSAHFILTFLVIADFTLQKVK